MSTKILVFILSLITLNYLVHARSLSDLTSESSSKSIKSLLRNRREARIANRFVTTEAWEADKAAVLTKFVKSAASPERNISIVAWQRVLNDEGKITNLNTIQLVIPPKSVMDRESTRGVDESKEAEDEENALPHTKINQLRKELARAEESGLSGSVSLEEFSEDGKIKTLIYMNNDELFAKQKGHITVYNKTATISQQEVEDFIDSLKPTIMGGPTVLRYDTEGNLLGDQSKIEPHILGRVDDNYEAPEDILLAGPKIIAKLSQKYPKEQIPKTLAIQFNLDFPEYTWRVLVDPVYYHLKKDVALTLTYDSSELDNPNSSTSYFVYGIKNE